MIHEQTSRREIKRRVPSAPGNAPPEKSTSKSKDDARSRPAEALRLGRERLTIALEAGQIATWDWDIVTGRITWGGEHRLLFDATAQDDFGTYHEFANRIHPEDRDLFQAEMKRAIEDGGDCHFEFRVTWNDESIHWLQADGRRVVDNSSTAIGIFGVLIDITQRKQTEALLRSTHDELEHRVTQRTAQLAQALEALEGEVQERKSAQQARQKLFRELVTAQEEERRRISRELHDQMGQHLTALLLGLKALEPQVEGASGIRKLRDLQKLGDDIGQQVHRIAFELHPTALDDLGLGAMLANYMEEWSGRYGITVDFHCGLDGQRLPMEIETTIYRIVQEALTNVVKHAKASHLSLILVRQEDHLLTVIEDDGRGFDVDSALADASGNHRLGLLGIKERVAMAGGTFQVESASGLGATLFVRIPTPLVSQEKTSP